MKTRRLLLYCLAALVLRLVWAFVGGSNLHFPDETKFWAQANNFAADFSVSAGDEHVIYMPLTAVVVGLGIRLFGIGILGAKVILAVAGAATVYPIARLAGAIHPHRLSEHLAAGAAAVYPFFIFYSGLILSETMYLLMTTWFFLVLIRPPERLPGAAGGALAGLAHLARPTMFYFLPVVFAVQALLKKWNLKSLALAAACFLVVVSPWVIRNYLLFGGIHFSTASAGQVLWEGNNPWNTEGGVSERDWDYLKAMPRDLDEFERDAWKKRRALDYIKDHPGKFVVVSLKRVARFWNIRPNAEPYDRGLYMWASILSFGPVLVLSLAGLWVLRDRWRATLPIWLFTGYMTALHAVTIGSIRYRLPLEPLLTAVAAATLARVLIRRTGSDHAR